MRAINKHAQQIMEQLLQIVEATGEEHATIDNSGGAFMPVHVEKIGNMKPGELVSVAHYGEQNGDMMRDPDMVFLHSSADGKFYPASFRNDYLGVDQESIVWNCGADIQGFRPRLQRDMAIFAGKWLENIRQQQLIA